MPRAPTRRSAAAQVALSVIELFLNGAATFSAFRSFRLARLLQLVAKTPRLRKLVNVLFYAMQEAFHLFLLLLIFLFIYTTLGMQLYGTQVSRADAVPALRPPSTAACVLHARTAPCLFVCLRHQRRTREGQALWAQPQGCRMGPEHEMALGAASWRLSPSPSTHAMQMQSTPLTTHGWGHEVAKETGKGGGVVGN